MYSVCEIERARADKVHFGGQSPEHGGHQRHHVAAIAFDGALGRRVVGGRRHFQAVHVRLGLHEPQRLFHLAIPRRQSLQMVRPRFA